MVDVDSERYWDERARENPLYFVDNQLDYDNPDVEAFWRGGEEVLDHLFGSVGFAPRAEDVVVDIGCGVGRLTRALAARTSHVYGVDVSGEMLSLARRYNAELDNVEWLHGDGLGLAVLRDRSTDGCFSHVVFQHIPDPEVTLEYVREMARVLRPGGWTLFVVSSDPEIHRGPARRGGRLRAFLGRETPDSSEQSWWGSAVDLAALQATAAGTGLRIEALLGPGTQFTTVFARKPELAGS
jgi:SAM-dependent methyltransferase